MAITQHKTKSLKTSIAFPANKGDALSQNPKWLNSCCVVTKLCLTLFDPMSCSTPGFPVLQYLPELLKLMSIESMIPSNHLILCCPLLLLPSIFSQHQGFFPTSWLFASGSQSTGTSASASVLPMNSQGWFPLGLTNLNSLQFKGLSRVFSCTTIRKLTSDVSLKTWKKSMPTCPLMKSYLCLTWNVTCYWGSYILRKR